MLILFVFMLAGFVLSHLFAKPGYDRGVYIYSLVVPISGYIGYALAEALFGSAMLQNVMMLGISLCIYFLA